MIDTVFGIKVRMSSLCIRRRLSAIALSVHL